MTTHWTFQLVVVAVSLIVALVAFFLYAVRSAIKNIDLAGVGLFFLTLALLIRLF